ncbi:hypothetical protein M885DRAFT_617996 [Pelagophyceae sp. CCMP2097]|nr:hypothetical protein M885DRAFT_617996 [Pelagophyceae sp. CCMP2097]
MDGDDDGPARRKGGCGAAPVLGALACLAVAAIALYKDGAFAGGGRLAEPHSLIMVADSGTFVGFGEASVLSAAATTLAEDPNAGRFVCERALRGVWFGQRALLVTTGIGETHAALCLESILQAYDGMIKEVIFLGTAGGSPAVGGIIDSDRCDAAPLEGVDVAVLEERVVGIGDVCVSPFSTDWDCQHCTWAAPGAPAGARVGGGACAAAPCSLHARADIFGDYGCSYFAAVDLADEVLRAPRDMPPTSPAVADMEKRFWAATGRAAPLWEKAHAKRGPQARVHGYGECAEATSMTYWSGAPYDELARDYVAALIDLADEGLGIAPQRNRTRADVLAISAMEGSGWMEALKLSAKWMAGNVPSVNIRGIADYTHEPLVRGKDGAWREDASWLTGAERVNATRDGYVEAIRTTSAVILALFENRRPGA